MRLHTTAARRLVIFVTSVGKRRTSGVSAPRTVHPLVEALTAAIVKAAEAQSLSREELSKRAHRAASTLYGWRNGNRESPRLLEIAAFAEAVGLHVALVGATVDPAPCGRPHVATDFERQLLASVRAITDPADQRELMRLVADFVLAHTSGARPPEPVGAQERA
jgi:transcriptional regulator with XRE-family HTH domain